MKKLKGITKLWAVALAVLLTAQMAVPYVEAAEKTAEKIPEKTIDTKSEAGKDSAAVKIGDVITYRITYKNDTDTKQNIVITDTLSEGLEFVSASDSGAKDNNTVKWTLKDVETGKTGEVTWKAKVTDAAKETVGSNATVKVGDKDAVSTGAVTSKVEKAAEPVAENQQPDTPEAPVTEPPADNQGEQEPEVAPEPEVKTQTAATTAPEGKIIGAVGTAGTAGDGGDGKTCDHDKYGVDWEEIVPATCIEYGRRVKVCKECKQRILGSEESTDYAEHTFTKWVTEKAATCTATGTQKAICDIKGCGAEGTKDIPKDENNHDWKIDRRIEATCTEKAKVVYKCDCGATKTEIDESSKLADHKYGEWKTEEPATCAKEGTKIQTCTVCEKEVQRTSIEKIAHDWETTYTVDKAPGKTTKGSKSIHCKNCDATKDAKEIPATGDHSISGIKSGTTYNRGSKITFTVKGIGMDNASPIKGDVRYVPVKWSVNPEGKWEKAPYTASFTLNKNGDYTLKITYDKEEFDGGKWVKTGDTDTMNVSFKIGSVKQVSKTTAKNTTKKSVPKTADTAPYASLIGLLLISGFVSIYVIKKQTKNK